MITSTIVRPVNSLIFVSDLSGGEGPIWEKDKPILSTSSCISIVCYPEQDGPTNVIFGLIGELKPRFPLAFEGELKTPSYSAVVQTVTHETILQMVVAGQRSHVRIWLSHPRWPDEVMIGLR